MPSIKESSTFFSKGTTSNFPLLNVAPGFKVLPSPSNPTSKGLSPGSTGAKEVSNPGIGLFVSKCA